MGPGLHATGAAGHRPLGGSPPDADGGGGRSERDRDRPVVRGRLETARRDVADVELERFEPAERPARQPRDDIDSVALVNRLREVRPAEGDPVEDVEATAERELG